MPLETQLLWTLDWGLGQEEEERERERGNPKPKKRKKRGTSMIVLQLLHPAGVLCPPFHPKDIMDENFASAFIDCKNSSTTVAKEVGHFYKNT